MVVASRSSAGKCLKPITPVDQAAHLVRRTALAEGIAAMASKPVRRNLLTARIKAFSRLVMSSIYRARERNPARLRHQDTLVR